MNLVRTLHPWAPAEPPVGLSVWPSSVGWLRAEAPDRHDTLLDHPVPHVLLAGSGQLRNSAGEWRLQAGDLFCLWPGVRCEYACDSGGSWEFCWLHLENPAALGYAAALGFSATVSRREPVDREATLAVGRRLLDGFRARDRRRVPDMAADLQRLVLAAGAEAPREESDLVATALTLARSSLHSGLNVSELARTLGVSRSTLFRAFQERLGKSPIDVLNRLRLERAWELLVGTDHSVATVARLVGYASGQYLIRRCQQDLGCSPGELRRRGRARE